MTAFLQLCSNFPVTLVTLQGSLSEVSWNPGLFVLLTDSLMPSGLIDFLIGCHPVAENLRRSVIFKIFPMISADGVFIGNTRYDYILFDVPSLTPRVFVLKTTFCQKFLCTFRRCILEGKECSHCRKDLDDVEFTLGLSCTFISLLSQWHKRWHSLCVLKRNTHT